MKKGIGYFFAELLIVVLGVSISLLLNDYMSNRKNLKQEKQLLTVIAGNLEMDSVNNLRLQKAIHMFGKSTHSLLQADQNTSLDSFNVYLDHITSYAKLQTVDIGFTELNNSGLEMQNDSLYRSLLTYYTALRPVVEEWNKINSEFVLEHMIPFIIAEFPALDVENKGHAVFAVEKVPGADILEDTRYRNLLATNLLYNQNLLSISQVREQQMQKLLADVRQELKNRNK